MNDHHLGATLMSATGRITLRLRNSLTGPRTLILEPWTTEYTISPGRAYDIIAEGNLSLPLEVELADDAVTIYAFDSSDAMLTVLEDGKELPQAGPKG